ncbi:MAG TPA: collagen-like protein [Anseongella sp.]
MKKRNFKTHLMALLFIASLISCEKEGPVGPQGPAGPQGEQGVSGPKGEKGNPGNANVNVYQLSVDASEWSNSYHYGDGNSFRSYDVPARRTGGVSIREFFDAGGVVLAYVKPNGNLGYDEWNITPHTFSLKVGYESGRYVYIGIRIECLPARGSLTIARTNNGWDNRGLNEDELPAKTDFRIVLIEAGVFARTKSLIDYSDYREVTRYFEDAEANTNNW